MQHQRQDTWTPLEKSIPLVGVAGAVRIGDETSIYQQSKLLVNYSSADNELHLSKSIRTPTNKLNCSVGLRRVEACRTRQERELKDWMPSRKFPIDRCSLEKEYIIPSDEPFPSYHRQQNNLPKAKKQFPYLGKVHSQALPTTIGRLHDTWEAFQKRGHSFPRCKKFGQFKSFVFPQFKDNPINGLTIDWPKLAEVPKGGTSKPRAMNLFPCAMPVALCLLRSRLNFELKNECSAFNRSHLFGVRVDRRSLLGCGLAITDYR